MTTSIKNCRTCRISSDKESEKLIPLSTEIEKNLFIFDYFKIYLNLEILSNKHLSNSICLKCLDRIIETKKFYNLCHDSENYNKLLIKSVNNDKYSISALSHGVQSILSKHVDVQKEDEIMKETGIESLKSKNEKFSDVKNKEKTSHSSEDYGVYIDYILKNDYEENFENNLSDDCKIKFETESDQNLNEKGYFSCNETSGPNEFKNSSNTEVNFEEEYLDTNYSELNQYERKNFDETSYFLLRCEICKWKIENPSKNTNISVDIESLLSHYSDNHNIDGYVLCCDKKITKKSKILKHITQHKKLHQNPILFKCEICDNNNIFSNEGSLKQHIIKNHDDRNKKNVCLKCEKNFINSYRLEMHLLTHLSKEEKTFLCSECNKSYATKKLLQIHSKVVHEKKYSRMCEWCAKVFKSKTFFEKHQLEEHFGQTLPKVHCNICNSWLKNEHTFRSHIRIHNDAGKQHKCEICGKIGPSRNAILKHVRFVHSAGRKFQCEKCDKAFKRAVTLKEHYTTHNFGEVLYHCSFCQKTFNSSANKHSHQKKIHPTEWNQARLSKLESRKP